MEAQVYHATGNCRRDGGPVGADPLLYRGIALTTPVGQEVAKIKLEKEHSCRGTVAVLSGVLYSYTNSRKEGET